MKKIIEIDGQTMFALKHLSFNANTNPKKFIEQTLVKICTKDFILVKNKIQTGDLDIQIRFLGLVKDLSKLFKIYPEPIKKIYSSLDLKNVLIVQAIYFGETFFSRLLFLAGKYDFTYFINTDCVNNEIVLEFNFIDHNN